MRSALRLSFLLAASLSAGLTPSPVAAQTVVTKHVSWNLDALVGSAAGPFSVNFQLVDGAGVGNLSVNAPFTSFTLANAVFFGMENHVVAPELGSPLEFDISLSYEGTDAPTPDQFSFAILDGTSFELPTTGPADASATLDVTGVGVVGNTYAGDTGRSPNAGDPGIPLAAPIITDAGASAVPEPGSLALPLPALGVVALGRRRLGNRQAGDTGKGAGA